jgi:hypothetical protein
MTETKKITKDRNYYRRLDNVELILLVEGTTTPTELELVLAERLEKAERDAGHHDYD